MRKKSQLNLFQLDEVLFDEIISALKSSNTS
jgi:hypothetical protein